MSKKWCGSGHRPVGEIPSGMGARHHRRHCDMQAARHHKGGAHRVREHMKVDADIALKQQTAGAENRKTREAQASGGSGGSMFEELCCSKFEELCCSKTVTRRTRLLTCSVFSTGGSPTWRIRSFSVSCSAARSVRHPLRRRLKRQRLIIKTHAKILRSILSGPAWRRRRSHAAAISPRAHPSRVTAQKSASFPAAIAARTPAIKS
jgi:hypothetical protein